MNRQSQQRQQQQHKQTHMGPGCHQLLQHCSLPACIIHRQHLGQAVGCHTSASTASSCTWRQDRSQGVAAHAALVSRLPLLLCSPRPGELPTPLLLPLLLMVGRRRLRPWGHYWPNTGAYSRPQSTAVAADPGCHIQAGIMPQRCRHSLPLLRTPAGAGRARHSAGLDAVAAAALAAAAARCGGPAAGAGRQLVVTAVGRRGGSKLQG